MVASLSNVKNYDLFLDVAKNMYKDRKDITFIGIGGGHEYKRIHDRIENEKIYNIKLIGPQKEVEPIINTSDIGLLFSNVKEGFSNSIMEYMALRKPVIATNAGGTKELIESGKTGFLVSNDNINEICQKIIFLLNNPDIRFKMGELAYKTIKDKFSVEKMAAQFIDLYKILKN